ncbi:Phosphopantothenoylcysteine decarboxylase [Plecturocebus cupreus]
MGLAVETEAMEFVSSRPTKVEEKAKEGSCPQGVSALPGFLGICGEKVKGERQPFGHHVALTSECVSSSAGRAFSVSQGPRKLNFLGEIFQFAHVVLRLAPSALACRGQGYGVAQNSGPMSFLGWPLLPAVASAALALSSVPVTCVPLPLGPPVPECRELAGLYTRAAGDSFLSSRSDGEVKRPHLLEVAVVTTERAKHFYSPQDIPVTLYSDADEWEVSAGGPWAEFHCVSTSRTEQSSLQPMVWLPEQTGWTQVRGQGPLGKGNEENICLASGLQEALVSSQPRRSWALAWCLTLSVLVLIWADETTEELCSHHPCPRGSWRQG